MFKKLIVLCGKQNTGKTTTLQQLVKKYGKLPGIILNPNKVTKKTRDFIAIFDIKKKKVGFVFAGDSKNLILSGAKILLSQKIKLDAIVCTCHPSEVGFAIKTYKRNSAIVVPKTINNNADNNLCINEILKNI